MDYLAYRDFCNSLGTRKVADERYGEVSEAIPALAELLKRQDCNDLRWHIWLDMSAQASRCGRQDLTVSFLIQRCAEFSDDPLTWNSLATYMALIGDFNEAIEVGKKAFQVALEQQRMAKYCGSALARIAIDADDYDTLEYVLAELVKLSGVNFQEDYKFEFDFVDDIDPNQIDASILQAYKNLKS